ncbi:MAG: DUF5717 family protein [Eubacteriales bacterium]|nr:DUF5717 family protein [Eubacteriales bacterium]
MKRRIDELLKEKFEYKPETLSLSPERIERQVPGFKRVTGKFSVSAAGSGILHGFVYSVNPRVTCPKNMFTGKKETLFYEADTRGMQSGDRLEGAFVICTTAGEYRLPYCMEIVGAEQKKERLDFLTPQEFAAAARNDFGEAYVKFASPDFADMAAAWGDTYRAAYEGTAGKSMNYHSLEQFLVAMEEKTPVSVTLETDHVCLRNPKDNDREEILLKKSTWGFAPVHISCDADFLTVERPEITTEEFVGSTYNLGYILHQDRLHAGRNFAKITVQTECRQQTCVVEVHCTAQAAAEKKGLQRRQEVLQLMNTYISYRAGRIGLGEWCGISLRCLDNFRKAGGNHIFLEMYRIYLLMMSGETVEAQMLLGELPKRKEELVIPWWKGCYLYLTTLGDAEKDYVDYVKNEIHELFLANQEQWILQWLMFRLNGNLYLNDTEKLDAIRRQYICGCNSPVMYLEAWEILKKEPLMLRNLEEFELHLLRFLCRENLVDRELSGQTAQLAGRVPSYHRLLYGILCSCFEKYPTKKLLTAICAMLIKGRKNTPEYADWFALGVRQDVRLAGMYEYYAQTAQDLNVRELPQTVRMYFSYNNTLDYEKKAAVYANIIRNRQKNPETYDAYRASMELFMEEQLQAGHINEDLALLYEALLTRMVMDARMAKGLAKALYTYEVICKNPQIRHVIVVHRQLAQEQRVMLVNGRACVQVYGKCRVFLEDRNGVRYGDASLFEMKKLLTRPVFEDYCREMEEEPEELILGDCCCQEGEPKITPQNVGRFVQMLKVSKICESYRNSIDEKLLLYYAENPKGEHLQEYLLLTDAQRLCMSHKAKLLELMTGEGMADTAYGLVQAFGSEGTAPGTLVRLCSWRIGETEGEQEEELLALCARCFAMHTYDESVLTYLMKYYEGPLETMKAIWQAGQTFLLEDFGLEERILVMVVFLRQGMEHTEDVFEGYWKKQGKAKLCRAYVVWMSYCSFVRQMDVKSQIFQYIEQNILGEPNAPKICRLAVLRYYVFLKKPSAGQQKWMHYLLEQFISEGMYFAFYKKLSPKLLRHFHLHDKYILEYRTNPEYHVTLYYRLNDGKEASVPMKNTYEGIFTAQFTLFYHDRLTWRLSVEEESLETQPQTLVCEQRAHRGATGRYELINRLSEAVEKQNEKQIQEISEQYIGQQYLVDELFTIN